VRFFRATELVTTLIEARDERSFLRLKGQLAKLDLLVSTSSGTCRRPKVGAGAAVRRHLDGLERTSMM